MPKADNKTETLVDDVFAEYRKLVAMQKFVSDLPRSLLHCSVEGMRPTVDGGLARLGTFVEADRASFVEFIAGDVARNAHECCANGIEPEIDNLQNVPRTMLDFWITSLQEGQPVHLPDITLLDGQGLSKESSLPAKIFSPCWVSR